MIPRCFGHRIVISSNSSSIRTKWFQNTSCIRTKVIAAPFSSLSSSSTTDNNRTTISKTTKAVFNKIACVGTGMMAQAFIEPMITGNVQPPNQFTIFDVNVGTMQSVIKTYPGIRTAETIHECVKDADLVICAVKPQNLTESFFIEMQKGSNPDSILLSVIAGKGLQTFYAGGYNKVVRSMPNTPATIGQGMTVWSATDNLTIEEREKIRIVLNSCGKSVCSFRDLFLCFFMVESMVY
jgi:hypothetical protein